MMSRDAPHPILALVVFSCSFWRFVTWMALLHAECLLHLILQSRVEVCVCFQWSPCTASLQVPWWHKETHSQHAAEGLNRVVSVLSQACGSGPEHRGQGRTPAHTARNAESLLARDALMRGSWVTQPALREASARWWMTWQAAPSPTRGECVFVRARTGPGRSPGCGETGLQQAQRRAAGGLRPSDSRAGAPGALGGRGAHGQRMAASATSSDVSSGQAPA